MWLGACGVLVALWVMLAPPELGSESHLGSVGGGILHYPCVMRVPCCGPKTCSQGYWHLYIASRSMIVCFYTRVV